MSGPFCERCGCAFEWQSGELTGPYCTCRPPIQTYATDTTMTTTTPTAPHDSPPYRISERQPESVNDSIRFLERFAEKADACTVFYFYVYGPKEIARHVRNVLRHAEGMTKQF